MEMCIRLAIRDIQMLSEKNQIRKKNEKQFEENRQIAKRWKYCTKQRNEQRSNEMAFFQKKANECSHSQSYENNRSTNGNNNNNTNRLCINVNEKLTSTESSNLKWIRFWDLHKKRPNLRIFVAENQNHTKQFTILLVTLVKLASNLASSKFVI